MRVNSLTSRISLYVCRCSPSLDLLGRRDVNICTQSLSLFSSCFHFLCYATHRTLVDTQNLLRYTELHEIQTLRNTTLYFISLIPFYKTAKILVCSSKSSSSFSSPPSFHFSVSPLFDTLTQKDRKIESDNLKGKWKKEKIVVPN